MKLFRLEDITSDVVCSEMYDAALFASGCEVRATAVPSTLSSRNIKSFRTLGFDTFRDSPARSLNDEYFHTVWGSRPEIFKSNDDSPVFSFLRETGLKSNGRPTRILVDYTSMSKVWYSAVLNWARFVDQVGEVEIDFVYAIGGDHDYKDPFVIKDVVCIPGCEGGPVRLFRAVAVFGLGFEGAAALSIFDMLEADVVYGFYAAPGAFREYQQRTIDSNEELIGRHMRSHIGVSLRSVEDTFRLVGEVIEFHRQEADITLVPMGPKPHVLAAVLLSMKFEEIACLRVTGGRSAPVDIKPNGQIVGTRVYYKG